MLYKLCCSLASTLSALLKNLSYSSIFGVAKCTNPGTGIVRVKCIGGNANGVWSNCQVPFRLMVVREPSLAAFARSEKQKSKKKSRCFMVHEVIIVVLVILFICYS